MIDSAAFVLCLDDESPMTPGERHGQFIIDGQNRAFANRWMDKPVQFAVTANGVSGSIYEHTKLDALDALGLERCLAQAVHANYPPEGDSYPVREHVFVANSNTIQRIGAIRHRCLSSGAFAPLDHRTVEAPNLGAGFLRASRARPNATAQLVTLLAVYLVDGGVRPAWEVANLGSFNSGRIDWIPTLTVPARTFLEAATTAAKTHAGDTGDGASAHDLRRLFDAATETYAKNMAGAARGLGFVRHLYALRGMLNRTEPYSSNDSSEYKSRVEEPMPSLFQSRAWDFTRRDGEGLNFRIAFMPNEYEDDDNGEGKGVAHVRWDEGGFIVIGEHSVLIYCRVEEKCTSFGVAARPKYAGAVCKSLKLAANMVASILLDADVRHEAAGC